MNKWVSNKNRAALGIPRWSQWLGLHALIIKGVGSISGQGTKIQAIGQQKKKKKINVITLVLINFTYL